MEPVSIPAQRGTLEDPEILTNVPGHVIPILKREFEKRGLQTAPLLAHSYERVMPGREYVRSIRDFWRQYYARLQRVVIQPLMEYPFQQKLRNQHQLYPDEQFIHYDWDFYAGDYLVCYPKAVPPSVFQEELRKTFLFLHGVPEEAKRDIGYQTSQALIRYTHRGKNRNLKRYVAYLKTAEQGKYDREGSLRREALIDDIKPWSVDIGVRTRRKVRIPGSPGFTPVPWPAAAAGSLPA